MNIFQKHKISLRTTRNSPGIDSEPDSVRRICDYCKIFTSWKIFCDCGKFSTSWKVSQKTGKFLLARNFLVLVDRRPPRHQKHHLPLHRRPQSKVPNHPPRLRNRLRARRVKQQSRAAQTAGQRPGVSTVPVYARRKAFSVNAVTLRAVRTLMRRRKQVSSAAR